MRIAVFGLGYVGSVSAACLANAGHTVIGVDPNVEKVDQINAGESPVLEPKVPELLAEAVANGRIRATTSASMAVANAELSLICVGTPSRSNGDIDLVYVETAVREIGAALAQTNEPHTVVIRSTVKPGTVKRMGAILEEASGRRLSDNLSIGVNPEFLREGQGVADFLAPPLILVGADDERTASKIASL